jgi:hypothetical protein
VTATLALQTTTERSHTNPNKEEKDIMLWLYLLNMRRRNRDLCEVLLWCFLIEGDVVAVVIVIV